MPDEESSISVEEKIIQAAVECIERYGISGTTNRRIAEIAGVNSAAINYYFRSKDVLVRRVMETTLNNAFDWKDIDLLPGDTPQVRCKAVFMHLIEGGVNYPGITRAHFYDLIAEGKYDSPAVERLGEFVERLARDLKSRGSPLELPELHLACMQITGAALLMIMAPRMFLKQFNFDASRTEDREIFVDRLVNRLLG
jgi:AcrR family transcriptional regulator